jgi:hypothetical protein
VRRPCRRVQLPVLHLLEGQQRVGVLLHVRLRIGELVRGLRRVGGELLLQVEVPQAAAVLVVRPAAAAAAAAEGGVVHAEFPAEV